MCKPYRTRSDARARKRSATLLLETLLKVRRKALAPQLGELIDTRYMSKLACQRRGVKKRHDHVYERRDLIKRLLSGDLTPKTVARLAVGCTVTDAEHRRLNTISLANPRLRGWARYRAAGVKVIDRKLNKLLTGAKLPTKGLKATRRARKKTKSTSRSRAARG